MLTLCVFEGHFCISQNYAVLATNPTTECCTTRNLLEADFWPVARTELAQISMSMGLLDLKVLGAVVGVKGIRSRNQLRGPETASGK